METGQILPPKQEDKKPKARSKLLKPEKASAEYSAEDIKLLADQVSKILDDKSKMLEYAGLIYPIRRDGAIRICLKIPKFRALTAKEKALKDLIVKELSSRGAAASNKEKAIKKMHTVPPGKSFTPALIEKMLRQSEAKQIEDENRAGQSYEDSDF